MKKREKILSERDIQQVSEICVEFWIVPACQTRKCCLSSFHVFNIYYTKGCNNLFCFLEMQLLGITPKRVPALVSQFLSCIN